MELSLLNLLLVLLAAWLAGNLADRFGYPSVLGELLAGILLGPPVLGLLHGSEALAVLAELGVLLMMLYIGMEIDPRGLGKASWAGLLAAIGGFVTPFVLAYLTVLWFGGTHLGGLFVGIAAGITALAVNSRILLDLRLLDTRVANVLMAGALISDTLALVAFAAIMGVVEVGRVDLPGIGLVTLKAVLFFAVTAAAGYKLFPWVGRRLTEAGLTGRTFNFTLVLLIAVLFGHLAELAGLHSILGAFIAGLFLRDNVLGRTLAADLTLAVREASLGLLAPIFFVTAGFAVSLKVFVGADLALFLAIMVVAVAGKVIGTVLFYLPTGYGWREGLTVALGMNGRGAVEIIVAGIGLERGLITREIFSILVFMAISTSATVPLFLKWGTDWLRRRGELVRAREERRGTVIVGAGPIGRLLGRWLSSSRPVWLLDSNADRCALAEQDGLRARVGNALQEQDLSAAGAAEADSLVVLTTNPAVNALVARMAVDVFGIPEVLVVQVSQRESERDGELRHLSVSSLFGGALPREEWEHRVALGAYTEVEHTVEHETTGEAFRTALEDAGPCLPMVIKRDEECLPFHAGSRLRPGDRVVTLQPERRTDTGPESFQRVVRESPILDLSEAMTADQFFQLAASTLSPDEAGQAALLQGLRQREAVGSTVLAPGLAIPHAAASGADTGQMLIARDRNGILFDGQPEPVYAVFVLVRTPTNRGFHLQALANIARVAGHPDFRERWLAAKGIDDLRALVLGPVPPRPSRTTAGTPTP